MNTFSLSSRRVLPWCNLGLCKVGVIHTTWRCGTHTISCSSNAALCSLQLFEASVVHYDIRFHHRNFCLASDRHTQLWSLRSVIFDWYLIEANHFDVSRQSASKTLYKYHFCHSLFLRASVVFIFAVDGYPGLSLFLSNELGRSWTPQNYSYKGEYHVLPCAVSIVYHWSTGPWPTPTGYYFVCLLIWWGYCLL